MPSQKVATYDLMPEMSAPGITDALVADAQRAAGTRSSSATSPTPTWSATPAASTRRSRPSKRWTLPRPDRDRRCKRPAARAIITADHGNAEQMWDDELKAPHTAHTSNPVPVILCDDASSAVALRDGTLRDVAPTMLALLGLATSPEMTGSPLLDD